jgi:phosphoribosylformylglycinamidine synthase
MLCVVEPAKLEAVLAVCARWEVNATAIGEVTGTRRLRVFDGETLVGDMPVTALVDECPAYDLVPAEPATPVYPAPEALVAADAAPDETLLALLGSANLASRRWAFEQYDSVVGSRTVRRPEQADAAVLLLPDPAVGDSRAGRDVAALWPSARENGPRPAIAVAIDGNGRRVAADPYRGAVEAVLECSANLACVGAEPLGLTNCLNFGNPEKPHIAWQLTRAVAGLGDACRALGVPVVGGNVSLYNEGAEGPIYPTPVVGLVGELPDANRAGRLAFARPGDAIALIAAASWAPSLAASELAKLRGEAVAGPLPSADLGELKALHAAIRQAVRAGTLTSVHDVAEGGVATALAEACLAGGVGARVRGLESEEDLFGEGPGAFLVSGPAAALRAFGSAARVIGETGGETLEIDGVLEIGVAELTRAHADGLSVLLR